MARTKEERLAVQVARDKRRRDEFRTQLAIIESANATREAYAKRERRVNGHRRIPWTMRTRSARSSAS
jgi:hypothetical protein